MAGIVVRPRARILHGHDWVFSSEVLKLFGSLATTVHEGPDRERRLRTAIRAAMSEYD